MRGVPIVAAMLLALAQARAQESHVILRVRDAKTGAPIWSAIVWIRDTRVQSSYTDSTGTLSRPIPAGARRFSVYASGYKSFVDSTQFAPGDTVIREIALVRNRLHAFSGLHIGGPAKFAVAMGPRYMVRPSLGRYASREQTGEVFAVVEPGAEAARLSAGYLKITGNLGTGWTLRASYLARYGNETGHYVGVEASLWLFALSGARVGLFAPISGVTEKRPKLFINFCIAG